MRQIHLLDRNDSIVASISVDEEESLSLEPFKVLSCFVSADIEGSDHVVPLPRT
jgi:hypothetical protein